MTCHPYFRSPKQEQRETAIARYRREAAEYLANKPRITGRVLEPLELRDGVSPISPLPTTTL